MAKSNVKSGNNPAATTRRKTHKNTLVAFIREGISEFPNVPTDKVYSKLGVKPDGEGVRYEYNERFGAITTEIGTPLFERSPYEPVIIVALCDREARVGDWVINSSLEILPFAEGVIGDTVYATYGVTLKGVPTLEVGYVMASARQAFDLADSYAFSRDGGRTVSVVKKSHFQFTHYTMLSFAKFVLDSKGIVIEDADEPLELLRDWLLVDNYYEE